MSAIAVAVGLGSAVIGASASKDAANTSAAASDRACLAACVAPRWGARVPAIC